MLEGLRNPTELMVRVVTLLSYGCPVQAMGQAFDLDERTVARWRERAGAHGEQVHQAVIETGKLDLLHVQADEIRVKGGKLLAWMGLAMLVSTRLWLAGTVRVSRDKGVADALLPQVRRCALSWRPLLVLTDGWAAYPGSIGRAFRDQVKETLGGGRACLRVWPALHIGTVSQRTASKRVVPITRKLARGLLEQAQQVRELSGGGSMLNTALIERLNGPLRERLASLPRKSRHAASRWQGVHSGMYLLGCTYHFCWPHQELSKAKPLGPPCTPAMASGLTEHVWRVGELLT